MPLTGAKKKKEPKSVFDVDRVTYEQLADKYRKFLDMTAYISSSEERKVFLSLTNDRDRDLFINFFWQQRDPTPGTPQNEYQEEIEKRFEHVNYYFKRGSTREGWKTDMGRIYMILGKPNSVESYEDKFGIYPVQVWYYYGDASIGLPTYFNITFYKPHGAGEWKIYNPSVDGPAALLVQTEPIDPNDYNTIYRKINELVPTLLGPAQSMIPNETSAYGAPSPRSNLILGNIFTSPIKRISATYATNFLKYKGFVTTESSVNYIESSGSLNLWRDPRFDFDFVNISIRPKKISVGYSEEKERYFFNFLMSVSFRQQEKIIYQFSKNYDFYFSEDDVKNLQSSGLILHEIIPVAPGQYDVVVFISNEVGKEFSYLDYKLIVPAGKTLTFLSNPFVSYKKEELNDNYFQPFRSVRTRFSYDTEKNFGMNDKLELVFGVYNLSPELHKSGRVEVVLKNLSDRRKYEKSWTLYLKDYEYQPNLNIVHKLFENEKPYSDYYDLTVRLINENNIVMDTKGYNFTIAPIAAVAHPFEAYKRILTDNPFVFYHITAQQYKGQGKFEEAEKNFELAIKNNSNFIEAHIELMETLLARKKYEQILLKVDVLKKSEKHVFEYYLYRGLALFYLNKNEDALDALLNANKIYNSDLRVLNHLGMAFEKSKDIKEAIRAFEASLKLNEKEKEIIQHLERLKKQEQR